MKTRRLAAATAFTGAAAVAYERLAEAVAAALGGHR